MKSFKRMNKINQLVLGVSGKPRFETIKHVHSKGSTFTGRGDGGMFANNKVVSVDGGSLWSML